MHFHRDVVVAVVWALITFLGEAAAAGQSRTSEIAGRLGTSPEWGSGYLNLPGPMNFRAGDELRLLIGGSARKVVVRLLPRGGNPDMPAGIVGAPIEVPANRVVRVVLTSARDGVVQISVHGGENPWGQMPLGLGNGPATLLSVERVAR